MRRSSSFSFPRFSGVLGFHFLKAAGDLAPLQVHDYLPVMAAPKRIFLISWIQVCWVSFFFNPANDP
jgi:hypothetical protein